MISKGWEVTVLDAEDCLLSMDKNMISLLTEKGIKDAKDQILSDINEPQNQQGFPKLISMGFRPTTKDVNNRLRCTIRNWKKKASNEMYRVIMNNL